MLSPLSPRLDDAAFHYAVAELMRLLSSSPPPLPCYFALPAAADTLSPSLRLIFHFRAFAADASLPFIFRYERCRRHYDYYAAFHALFDAASRMRLFADAFR